MADSYSFDENISTLANQPPCADRVQHSQPDSSRISLVEAASPTALRRRALLKSAGLASAGILLPSLCGLAQAASARLLDFRIAYNETATLHVDLTTSPDSLDVFLLSNPDRLVIDLGGVTGEGIRGATYADGLIGAVRFGNHQSKLRMVVDLRGGVKPSYDLIARHNGVRLHLDLGVPAGKPSGLAQRSGLQQRRHNKPLRDVVVAIDAGHGGKDPGAIGKRKTLEKNITLEVAGRLARTLDSVHGVRVVMTRNSDTYIGLRKRTELARGKGADLFLSLHADAFPRREAKGSSVYALSLKGASSETAKALAQQENSYDPLEGIDTGDMSEDLKRTLIELTQSSTIESSLGLGKNILHRLGNVGNIHKKTVEQANFAVLRSPDITSVLIETAFISNPSEEKKLNSSRFQKKLALAIRSGVVDYLSNRAIEGTWLGNNAG